MNRTSRFFSPCRFLKFVLMYIQIRQYIVVVEFTWDEGKNRSNRRKHGISFETAILAFQDPYHISRQDREVEDEARWQTIGMVNGIHLLLVAHALDEEIEVVRVVSARKATRLERSIYAQGS